MAVRQSSFNLACFAQLLRSVKKIIKGILSPDSDSPSLRDKVIRHNSIMNFVGSLKSFFNSEDDFRKFDMLMLHRNLSRDEKVRTIDLFLNGSEATYNLNLNELCTTSSAGNTGIDSSEVRSIIRTCFLPSILGMIQEKFKTSHNPWDTLDKHKLYFLLE